MKPNAARVNLLSLSAVLTQAEKSQYAVGSFSPRYTSMIRPILKVGQALSSPIIVQISEKELVRYQISATEFAESFFQEFDDQGITVPVVLHLDHTKNVSVIEEAIAAGFTSVMIDASEQPIDENIRITKEVVAMATARKVSVEAELGKIGTTDYIETETDEELYTDPREALRFVTETDVDALAVSVGTAHGVYVVKQPTIDFARIRQIRALTPVHLVLHGGSGIEVALLHRAIMGGISKVNIATDLELALLGALGRSERMTDLECRKLDVEALEIARAAVSRVVHDKITSCLGSAGQGYPIGLSS